MKPMIDKFIEAVLAAVLSMAFVALIVAWLGIGSGLIDPFRLFSSEPPHRVLTVK